MFRCVSAFYAGYCDVAVKKARDRNFRFGFSLEDLDPGASISTIIIELCLDDSRPISWLCIALGWRLAYQVVGGTW